MNSLYISTEGLSPRHIRALERFIEKFCKGAREHGDLQKGKKWTHDMLDEAIDKSFYEIFQLIELEDEDGR